MADAVAPFRSAPQRAPWQVLEVATHIWNQGGDFASIPSRKDFELPTPPVRPENALGSAGDEVSTDGGDGTAVAKTAKNTYPAEMRAYMQERRRVEKLNRELHALRCDANYKLEIAKAVRADALSRTARGMGAATSCDCVRFSFRWALRCRSLRRRRSTSRIRSISVAARTPFRRTSTTSARTCAEASSSLRKASRWASAACSGSRCTWPI